MSTESDIFEGGPVPKHTYETVAGTEPVAHAAHEPRTLVGTTTTGDVKALKMMTEIGDGVFVAWDTCKRCGKHISHCACPDGPQEPHYMQAWRDKRFERSLDARPEPSYSLLPKVLSWVRERGYTVKKKGERDAGTALFVELFQAVGACEAPEGTQVDDVLEEFQERYDEIVGRTNEEVRGTVQAAPPVPDDAMVVDSLTEKADEALDAALQAVTNERNLEDHDAGF